MSCRAEVYFIHDKLPLQKGTLQ